ncbi:hypothetical protein ACM26V_04465 [Salipaludibacillus sp. HK11]|uniref:hypothetical protein n=1 Tax=Salipaludibacillus sp. HK11 TaxID=3394320 RepID=UPI0039FBC3BA
MNYEIDSNGEIKNITKGKFSRTSEGLYCHHIDEKKELKISDQLFIKRNKIPFEYQRKDRLVYCDLVEHSILHVLITKETSFEFGYPGYGAFLKPMIEVWYLDKIIPNSEWMKRCYNQSFLDSQEAFDILKEMQKTLAESYFNTILDYYEEKKRMKEESSKRELERDQYLKDDRDRLIKRAKLLHSKSPRKEIVISSYYLKYEDTTNTFYRDNACTYEDYESKMKIYTKEKILEELNIYLENLVF